MRNLVPPSTTIANLVPPSIAERKLRIIQLEQAIRAETFSLVEQKRKSKSVPEHFQFIRDIYDDNDNHIVDYVACFKCKDVIYYNTDNGTAPLIRHFKDKHKPGPNNTIDSFLQRPIKIFSSFDKDKAKSAATDFVVKDCRPFEAISGNGLINLLIFFTQVGHKYGPLTQEDVTEILPSPQTVSRHVEKLSDECKAKIKDEVLGSAARGISMTTDIWTDGYRRISYLCITAHYFVEISSKLVYRSRVTCLRPMDPKKRKTHDVILQIINDEISKLGLNNYRNSINFVTDRGANIKAALKDQYQRFNCQAHLFDNIVKETYESKLVKKIINVLKPIVRYVKINGYNEQFKVGNKIKSFSKTRWNSAYYMIKSVYNSWDQLESLLKTNKSKHYSKFKALKKEDLEQMITFLRHFKDFTNVLESSSVNIFNVLPCILKMRSLLQLASTDSAIIKQMKKKAILYFNKRIQFNDVYYLSTMLFPPLNNLKSYDEEIRAKGHLLLRTKFNEMKSQLPASENTRENTTRSYFNPTAEAAIRGDERDELEKYLSLSIPYTETFDVLEWWQAHKNEFPILYSLMLKYFSIPSSSAQSEREFSQAGNIVTDKRSNLNPQKVENLLIVNRNSDLVSK